MADNINQSHFEVFVTSTLIKSRGKSLSKGELIKEAQKELKISYGKAWKHLTTLIENKPSKFQTYWTGHTRRKMVLIS